jgi:hypothetical protein
MVSSSKDATMPMPRRMRTLGTFVMSNLSTRLPRREITQAGDSRPKNPARKAVAQSLRPGFCGRAGEVAAFVWLRRSGLEMRGCRC